MGSSQNSVISSTVMRSLVLGFCFFVFFSFAVPSKDVESKSDIRAADKLLIGTQQTEKGISTRENKNQKKGGKKTKSKRKKRKGNKLRKPKQSKKGKKTLVGNKRGKRIQKKRNKTTKKSGNIGGRRK